MKLKEIISLIVVITLLFSQFSVNAEIRKSKSDYEPKIYANAHIKEEFCGRVILVVMDKKVGGVNVKHSAKFFGDFPIESIVDLTIFNKEQYAELQQAIKRGEWHLHDFRQILAITLSKDCKQNVLDVIAQLEKIDGIVSAEPNYYGYNTSTSPPPAYNPTTQWNLTNINATGAWNINTGNNVTVRVGVIDTGISDHDDFQFQSSSIINRTLGRGFDSGGNPYISLATDDMGHGTLISGIIATWWKSGGIIGVARNVSLVPLKVDNATGIPVAAAVSAISYAGATYHNVNTQLCILNFSLGWVRYQVPNSPNPPPIITLPQINSMQQAILNYPGLFVNSAGNHGLDNDGANPDYPSAYNLPNIITVGASDKNNNRGINWSNGRASNYGKNTVHLFAPGVNVTSIWSGGTHTDTGTSFAAPHVAGVAALIRSKYPHLSPIEIKWAILAGVDKIEALEGLCATSGRLNAHKALQMAADPGSRLYGVHYIRNYGNGRYLDSWGSSSTNPVSLYDELIGDEYQQWVLQRDSTGVNWQLRTVANIILGFGTLQNNFRLSTVTNNLTINRYTTYPQGSVTFSRMVNGNREALTANGSALIWQAYNTSNLNQRWILETDNLSYRQGDVNGDWLINTNDRVRAQAIANVPNAMSVTALEFYLADVNRDGLVNSLDVGHIDTLLPTQLVAGEYYLESIGGRYLHMFNSGSNNGARPVLFTGFGNLNTQFTFTHLGNGDYRIQTKLTGQRSLEVVGSSLNNGEPITLRDWTGANNQRWRLLKAGQYYIIVNKHSGKALDVVSNQNDALTHQNTIHYITTPGNLQLFKLNPV